MTGSTLDTPQVFLRLPTRGQQTLESVLAELRGAPTLAPYDPIILDFCAAFAQRLSRRSRGVPELQALAFWMRRAELIRLKANFEVLATEQTVLMPRGLVFHVPPANVDTIFIYSWLMSLLAGNRNVIRLSSRETDQMNLILDVLNETLQEESFELMRGNTVMLSYGHDRDITTALSLAADVRVIWGGDRTVATIRQSPLAPHATELTFPDRFSLAAVHAERYLAETDDQHRTVAEHFFNDAFWFDQMGCSSPRLLVWVGEGAAVQQASQTFFAHLQVVTQTKGYQVDTATAINKLTFAMRAALDHPVQRFNRLSNEVAVLPLAQFAEVRGEFCGAGLFYQLQCNALTDLVPHIERRDQTLSYHSFEPEELRQLVVALNGRGLDRLVPFGEALNFNRYWDGHDLLQAFTRRVYLQLENK
ncbi:acyl-CoA reductase [Deinococcus sp. NW-56]|uniref:acyl-CoA reductase n=1 Tax=Deinococcus sp. NW-56 TaxID=2080419 RepID=UPI000CF4415B|nr:acyl-CoA reductase [Deinococcus sp. NW-56]